MLGVLLDRRGQPRSRPELLGPSGLPVRVEQNLEAGWSMPGYEQPDTRIAPDFGRLPQHILDMLERSRRADFSKSSPFMNGSQGWRALEGVIITDTALTLQAEALMVPDFLLAIPRPGQPLVGVSYKYTLIGEQSCAITTPGQFTHRLRWGGLAGTILVASASIAPTGTQVITATPIIVEYWLTVRAQPTPATTTIWCQGRITWPGIFETTPASTTIIVTQLKAMMIPLNTPTNVTGLDASSSKALSPTYQPSVTTANLTTHLATVESLN